MSAGEGRGEKESLWRAIIGMYRLSEVVQWARHSVTARCIWRAVKTMQKGWRERRSVN
jgi:hypothetical protein